MIQKHSLILSMGHPIKDRMARLSTRPKYRSIGIGVSAAICAAVLAATSFAHVQSPSFPKGAVAPILTSVIDGQEYTIQGQPFALKYVNIRRKKSTALAGADEIGIYSLALNQKDDIVGYDPNADDLWERFPPMHHSDRCVRHIAQGNALPYWYKETGAVVHDDEQTDVYRMTCLPGTEEHINAMSTEEFIQGLKESPELSAVERKELALFYKKGAPKSASIIIRSDGT